jgi:hypothetical protein
LYRSTTLYESRKQKSKKQKDKISDQLKAYAEFAGTKDVKGSYYVQSEKYIFGKQARTAVAFVHNIAVEALTKRGLTEAIDVVRTVNEDRFACRQILRIQRGVLGYQVIPSAAHAPKRAKVRIALRVY